MIGPILGTTTMITGAWLKGTQESQVSLNTVYVKQKDEDQVT